MEELKSRLDKLAQELNFRDAILSRMNQDGNLFYKDPVAVNPPRLEAETEKIISEGKKVVPVLTEKYKEFPFTEAGFYEIKCWLIQLLTQFRQANDFVISEMEEILKLQEKNWFNNNATYMSSALIGLYQRAIKNDSDKLLNIWWKYFRLYWEAFTYDTNFYKYNSFYLDSNEDHSKLISLIEKENSENPVEWITEVLGELREAQNRYNKNMEAMRWY